MWKKYFGPRAKIIGIDINPECKEYEESNISIRIGDQGDRDFLQSIVKEFGPFDIVLDDGSHKMDDIKVSFEELYPNVSKNGIYLVEDLHTAYLSNWGGGVKAKGSFIEFSKDLIDHLYTTYTGGELSESDFSRSTLSMHFYDSIIAFEKGEYGPRIDAKIGGNLTPAVLVSD